MTTVFQRNGLNAIPAPAWGDLANIELYMEGWPKSSIIAINSTGVGLDKRCRYIWIEDYHAMLDILKPEYTKGTVPFVYPLCTESGSAEPP